MIYIIKRDGAIYEITAENQTIENITKTLNSRTLVYIKDLDASINGADVSEVLNEEQYINYVNTKRPKMYPRKGKMKPLAREEMLEFKKPPQHKTIEQPSEERIDPRIHDEIMKLQGNMQI